jgi:hypothetical protein
MSREKSTTPAVRTRAPRKSAVAAAKAKSSVASFVDPGQRAALIAEAAYFRAQKRGFAPGHEVEDWLAAEADVDAKLLRAAAGAPRA